MNTVRDISVLNCLRRPGRSLALCLVSFLLCFVLVLGIFMVGGLRSGLSSLQARLGADIMVVPYEAITQSKLKDMILQGLPGYFYMNRSVLQKLEKIPGVERLSSQFYLASAASSCCSYKVQLIGFDPETDFTILPWAKASYHQQLKPGEILVGHSLNAFPGDELYFYGTEVTVASRLDETGTWLDTAIFSDLETIRGMLTKAKTNKIFDFGNVDPQRVVSCALISVADGFSEEEVMNHINLYVKDVKAVRPQTLITDVSDKLLGIADLLSLLLAVIWILTLLIQLLVFWMMTNERKKEFAVLRLMGGTRHQLVWLVLREALMITGIGSLVGGLLGLSSARLLSGIVETGLGLPFLLPQALGQVGILLAALFLSIGTGLLAGSLAARKAGQAEPATILRAEG